MAGLKLDDRLQQHFDGEIAGEDAKRVREALESDAELRAKLEGLSHLRYLLNVRTEALETELDSDAMFAAIEAQLAQDAPANDDPMLLEPAPLVIHPSLPQAPISVAPPPVVPIHAAKKPRRSRVGWYVGGGALAAAAALLLVIWRPSGDPTISAAPPPGSEVTEVDFGYSTGAIFTVEGQEGERYAVVWVSDEKAEVEADERMQ